MDDGVLVFDVRDGQLRTGRLVRAVTASVEGGPLKIVKMEDGTELTYKGSANFPWRSAEEGSFEWWALTNLDLFRALLADDPARLYKEALKRATDDMGIAEIRAMIVGLGVPPEELKARESAVKKAFGQDVQIVKTTRGRYRWDEKADPAARVAGMSAKELLDSWKGCSAEEKELIRSRLAGMFDGPDGFDLRFRAWKAGIEPEEPRPGDLTTMSEQALRHYVPEDVDSLDDLVAVALRPHPGTHAQSLIGKASEGLRSQAFDRVLDELLSADPPGPTPSAMRWILGRFQGAQSPPLTRKQFDAAVLLWLRFRGDPSYADASALLEAMLVLPGSAVLWGSLSPATGREVLLALADRPWRDGFRPDVVAALAQSDLKPLLAEDEVVWRGLTVADIADLLGGWASRDRAVAGLVPGVAIEKAIDEWLGSPAPTPRPLAALSWPEGMLERIDRGRYWKAVEAEYRDRPGLRQLLDAMPQVAESKAQAAHAQDEREVMRRERDKAREAARTAGLELERLRHDQQKRFKEAEKEKGLLALMEPVRSLLTILDPARFEEARVVLESLYVVDCAPGSVALFDDERHRDPSGTIGRGYEGDVRVLKPLIALASDPKQVRKAEVMRHLP